MTADEFVLKAMADKKFLFEVFTHVPDSMMKDDENASSYESGEMGKLFADYCWPGAQAMGCEFSQEELQAASNQKVLALRGLQKGKFVWRMLSTLAKAKPKKKR